MPVFSTYTKYTTKLHTAQFRSLASQLRDCCDLEESDEDTLQNVRSTFNLLYSLRTFIKWYFGTNL